MHKTKLGVVGLLIGNACLADQPPPPAFDLDEALARQASADLISAATSAYDCDISEHSFRRLGREEKPVYMIEVAMSGPECEEALLLLARHGSGKDLVFRLWEPAPDVQSIDPVERDSNLPE